MENTIRKENDAEIAKSSEMWKKRRCRTIFNGIKCRNWKRNFRYILSALLYCSCSICFNSNDDWIFKRKYASQKRKKTSAFQHVHGGIPNFLSKYFMFHVKIPIYRQLSDICIWNKNEAAQISADDHPTMVSQISHTFIANEYKERES